MRENMSSNVTCTTELGVSNTLIKSNNLTTNGTVTEDPEPLPKESRDALIYIIVVLAFYALGIAVMMIKYLKRERQELEEEQILEEYRQALRKQHEPSSTRTKPKALGRSPSGMLRASLPNMPSIPSVPSFNQLLTLAKRRPSQVTFSIGADDV